MGIFLREDRDFVSIENQKWSDSSTEIKIKNRDLSIEEWNTRFVRAMHQKLPEFEAELRRKYGCGEEKEK